MRVIGQTGDVIATAKARRLGQIPSASARLFTVLAGTQAVGHGTAGTDEKSLPSIPSPDAAPTALVQVLTDPSEGRPDAPPSSSPSYDVTLALNWMTFSGAQ